MRHIYTYIQQIQSREQGKPRESMEPPENSNQTEYPAPKARNRDVAKTTNPKNNTLEVVG